MKKQKREEDRKKQEEEWVMEVLEKGKDKGKDKVRTTADITFTHRDSRERFIVT